VKKLIAFVAVVAMATPAFALPTIESTKMDNGDGTTTYWLTIESLPEVSFLELNIMGDLQQIDGGATYDTISASPWAPSVVFTSDATLAGALNPAYLAAADLDTVIADDNWPGKVSVVLTPVAGSGGSVAGTDMVQVALTSFTGGLGGPLPGGPIPLAHITIPNDGGAWVTGKLQSDSDQVGTFEWHSDIPEPSTLALAGFGLMGLVAGMRRRS
jgi:hypothetical protein